MTTHVLYSHWSNHWLLQGLLVTSLVLGLFWVRWHNQLQQPTTKVIIKWDHPIDWSKLRNWLRDFTTTHKENGGKNAWVPFFMYQHFMKPYAIAHCQACFCKANTIISKIHCLTNRKTLKMGNCIGYHIHLSLYYHATFQIKLMGWLH